MSTVNSFIGQIDLLALINSRMQQVDGQECIVIPVSANPAIFPYESRNGQKKAQLELFFRQTLSGQYGNTHFIKTIVGKSNRERLGISREELPKYTPIVGNMKPYESREAATASAQAPQDGGFSGF